MYINVTTDRRTVGRTTYCSNTARCKNYCFIFQMVCVLHGSEVIYYVYNFEPEPSGSVVQYQQVRCGVRQTNCHCRLAIVDRVRDA